MKKLAPKQLLNPKLPENAQVKVIGLGGVGSIVARYAAVFLASFGQNATLTLIDGDVFEPGNASRMLFGSFGNKAAVVREELLPRFQGSTLAITAVEEYLSKDNLSPLLQNGDIILLCVDNHTTRKMVSDFCRDELGEVCLISGGNDGVDGGKRGTYGSVQFYGSHVHDQGVMEIGHPLTHFHPEIENPKDKHPGDLNCTELVASVPQILFANLAVASAILNTLLLYLSENLHYSELSFDIAEGLMRPSLPIKDTNAS